MITRNNLLLAVLVLFCRISGCRPNCPEIAWTERSGMKSVSRCAIVQRRATTSGLTVITEGCGDLDCEINEAQLTSNLLRIKYTITPRSEVKVAGGPALPNINQSGNALMLTWSRQWGPGREEQLARFLPMKNPQTSVIELRVPFETRFYHSPGSFVDPGTLFDVVLEYEYFGTDGSSEAKYCRTWSTLDRME